MQRYRWTRAAAVAMAMTTTFARPVGAQDQAPAPTAPKPRANATSGTRTARVTLAKARDKATDVADLPHASGIADFYRKLESRDSINDIQGNRMRSAEHSHINIMDVPTSFRLIPHIPGISIAKGDAFSPHAYIIGGDETPEDRLDGIGSIMRNGELICTGTIIGRHTIITAAHCLEGATESDLTFRTGSSIHKPAKNVYSIKHLIPHGDYHPRKQLAFPDNDHNDIALIITTGALKEHGFYLPSELSANDFSSQAAGLTFVGFGFSRSGSQKGGEGQKRQVRIPINSVNVYEKVFGFQVAAKNTCNGDSGGPALAIVNDIGPDKKMHEYLTVVGINSWGDGPCSSYGIETRVDAYTPWVLENIK